MVSAGIVVLKSALGQSWRTVPHVRLMLSYDCGRHICTATVLKHTLLVHYILFLVFNITAALFVVTVEIARVIAAPFC
jgi:NADH:ubiquinone oxidoreductase subunit 3 (subunit A)